MRLPAAPQRGRERRSEPVASIESAAGTHRHLRGPPDRVSRAGLLLEAWVAERGQEGAAAVDAYRRALEVAGRVGFGGHAAFALCGLGSNALTSGDLHEAQELQRRALATAEAAQASWAADHARVQLGRTAAAAGDADPAERLYRRVIEWSQTQRPHQARESLFLALAGSPATAALLGLAELAEARGDTAAARCAKAWKARERAEAAIGEIRSRRIAVDERLAQARDAAGDASQEARKRVLNVAPAMTFAESMAATSSLVPGSAFEDLNKAEALRCAAAGAARATIAPTT